MSKPDPNIIWECWQISLVNALLTNDELYLMPPGPGTLAERFDSGNCHYWVVYVKSIKKLEYNLYEIEGFLSPNVLIDIDPLKVKCSI